MNKYSLRHSGVNCLAVFNYFALKEEEKKELKFQEEEVRIKKDM